MRPTRTESLEGDRVRVEFGDRSIEVVRTQERDYSGVNEETWLPVYEGLWRSIPVHAPRLRVVDAGCGCGYGADWLCDQGASVLAVDTAPEAVAFAALRAERAVVLRCSMVDLDDLLPHESVDVVLAVESVEHLPSIVSSLVPFYDVLRPGGWLGLSTPDKNVVGDPNNPYHFWHHTEEQLRVRLDLRGFKNVTRLDLGPVFTGSAILLAQKGTG